MQNNTLFGEPPLRSDFPPPHPLDPLVSSPLLTYLGSTPPPSPYPDFRAVHHVPGPERRPPNLYDSTVYASSPNAISLAAGPSRPRAPTRVDVPGVPGAFLVLDVFTPEECLQIVQAAEAIGFEKDQAAEGSALQKTSVSRVESMRMEADLNRGPSRWRRRGFLTARDEVHGDR
jgi:hypothetical protein